MCWVNKPVGKPSSVALQLFEALTGESWTGNIWNSMAAVGPAACLFWIAWDIIGHKILLNLFLAILINNFQDQEVTPRCAVLPRSVLCCHVQSCAVLCCAVPCRPLLCRAVLCCVMPCHATLPCCALLCLQCVL